MGFYKRLNIRTYRGIIPLTASLLPGVTIFYFSAFVPLILFSVLFSLLFAFFPAPSQASDSAPVSYLYVKYLQEPRAATGDFAKLPPEEELSNEQVYPTLEDFDLKGWDHLFSLMLNSGFDPIYAAGILSDERMPNYEPLYFSLSPSESKHMYRKHNTAQARTRAVRFYRKHYRFFKETLTAFGVPENVILAILQVETNCGSFTGRSRTFYRLARLAAAASPDNVTANYQKHRVKDRRVERNAVQARALWLEQEFLPHTLATVSLAERMNLHPLDLRGSSAGAIGIPQFLPGHVDRYGIDGDGNLQVDLFEPADAIASVANYLLQHGWIPYVHMLKKEKRQVIWAYNHSESYIDTVLSMADALEPQLRKVEMEIEDSFNTLVFASSTDRASPKVTIGEN